MTLWHYVEFSVGEPAVEWVRELRREGIEIVVQDRYVDEYTFEISDPFESCEVEGDE